MNFITKAECCDWCKQRGLEVDDDRRGIRNTFAHSMTTRIPPESRRHAILSRYLIHVLPQWDNCLLWVTTWGVWPTEENEPIYNHLRSGYGDNRPLIEAPGHLFDQSEKEDAVGFLRLVFTYGRDAYLIPSNSTTMVFVSHDEYVDVFVGDKQRLKDIEDGLLDLDQKWKAQPSS